MRSPNIPWTNASNAVRLRSGPALDRMCLAKSMPQSSQMVYRSPVHVFLAVRQTPSMQSVVCNRADRSEDAAFLQQLRELLCVLRTGRRESAQILNHVARAVSGPRAVGRW